MLGLGISPFNIYRVKDPLEWLGATVSAIGTHPAIALHFDTGNYGRGEPFVLSNQATEVDAFYTGDGLVFNADGVEIYEAGTGGRTLDDDLNISHSGVPWPGFATPTPLYCGMVEWVNSGSATLRSVVSVSNQGFNRSEVEQTDATTARLLAVGGAGAGDTISASPARNRMAWRINDTDFRFSTNGSAVTESTSGTTGAQTHLHIGAGAFKHQLYMGTICKFEGTNADLSNAQLQAWSTI